MGSTLQHQWLQELGVPAGLFPTIGDGAAGQVASSVPPDPPTPVPPGPAPDVDPGEPIAIPDPIRSIRAFHARRACQIFPINPLPEPHQSSPHRRSRRRSNPWARSRPTVEPPARRRRSLRPPKRPSRHRRPTIQATTPARVGRRPTIVERSYAAAAVRPYALRHRPSDASFRAMLPSLPPAHAVAAFRGLDEPRLDQRQRHVAPSVGPAEQLANLRPVLAPAHATAAGSGFRCSQQVAIIRPLVQRGNASEKYRGIVLRT
jgi:hypothetical protein